MKGVFWDALILDCSSRLGLVSETQPSQDDKIRAAVIGCRERLVEIRRHIHAHPELSGQEHQTAAFVAGVLSSLDCRVHEGVGRTGVVADFGQGDGLCVGLRVDMDALPIEEKTELPFASTRQGLMHACGHDIHTSVGLGVAMVLAPLQQHLPGRVRILFQPAEEIAQGARWMMNAGALEGLDAIYGLHVFPPLAAGCIAVREGTFAAAADELIVDIHGESGHGARPHEALDAIWIAARVVTGLQEAINRRIDPLHPVVLSFGRIEGGHAFNVIADLVRLQGTVRCLHPKTHQGLPRWIEGIIHSICATHGATASVDYRQITPPVINDARETRLMEKTARRLLGDARVERLENASLGAEDFAEMLAEVPGSMLRLGVAGPGGCHPLHHCRFNPDERCLETGVEVLAGTLLARLRTGKVETPPLPVGEASHQRVPPFS